MPLPVGHSLAGGALWAAGDADLRRRPGWKRLVLAVFLANAPDLDMIPGILMGDPNRFHHGPSHSLGFALVVAVIAAVVARVWRPWPIAPPGRSVGPDARDPRGRGGWWPAVRTGALVGAVWLSHVFLDAFAQDYSQPRGVPALWPLSGRYFNPYGWFPWVDKLDGEGTPLQFVASLLSPQNFWAISVELLTLVPVVALVLWWRREKGAAGASDGAPARLGDGEASGRP